MSTEAIGTKVVLDLTPEVEALAKRPYGLVIEHDQEDRWIGRILELPGHLAVGATPEEMLTLSEDAKRAWIATALALGRSVPPPLALQQAPTKSGKFVVRVPPPIRVALAQEADRHRVSLNELVSDTLALVVAKGFDGVVQALADSKPAAVGGARGESPSRPPAARAKRPRKHRPATVVTALR